MRYKTDKARWRRMETVLSDIRMLEAAASHRNAKGDRLLTNLEQELLELVRENLAAHPEEFTQLPNGNWVLNEAIVNQKSAVN